MAQTNVRGAVNSTPVVFNGALLSINGDSDGIEINGYIKSISFDTGTQSENIKTINTDGDPIDNNLVCSDPNFRMSFAPGAWQKFYQFINDKYTQFTLQVTYYQVGNLQGAQQQVLFQKCRQNVVAGGSDANSPANPGSISFVSTKITYL